MELGYDSFGYMVRRYLAEFRRLETGSVASAQLDARAMVRASLTYLRRVYGDEFDDELYGMLRDAEALPTAPITLYGHSPEFWSEQFAKIGVTISPVALRRKAVTKGQFYRINGSVLVTGDQVEKLYARDNTPEARKARALAARYRRKETEGVLQRLLRRRVAVAEAKRKSRRRRKP